MRAIQEDLCWRVVYMWYFNGCARAEIADTLFLSQSTVKRVLQRFNNGERIYLDDKRRGPRQDKRLLPGDVEVLKRLLEEDASMYLDELQHALRTRTGRSISLPTICRCLRHELRITRKLLTKRASEACEHKRADFVEKCKRFSWNHFVWIDESSVDRRTHQRRWGRAPIGKRTGKRTFFLRGKRYSVMPIMGYTRGLIDWYIVEGSIGGEKYQHFVVNHLLPVLTGRGGFPNSESVVVLDNFVTHRSAAFMDSIERHNGVVLHLPPYSPDFNPIEMVFSKVKLWLKRRERDIEDGTLDPVFAIHKALESVTRQDCRGYIERSCRGNEIFYLYDLHETSDFDDSDDDSDGETVLSASDESDDD